MTNKREGVNAELFLKIAERVENDPDSYDQKYVARDPGIYGGCIFCHAEEILGLSHFEGEETVSGLVPSRKTVEALGLDAEDAIRLYSSRWKPKPEYTVPAALRAIAGGASVQEVSQ